MHCCNRRHSIDLGDGYGLFFLNELVSEPSPKARSFELPDDSVHYAPDRPADVKHVKLEIALDFEQETISGTVYTSFSALYDELQSISFDAVELDIEQVTLEDGTKLAFTSSDKTLIVTLDRPYRHGERFTVAVSYHAKPRTGLHFIKPAAEDPTRPEQAWTFGQPRYHSHWFPCHDSPNDRATTEIIVTVPARFLTVSNGNLLSVSDNGDTKTHHWRHDIPHAAYLISLVVADFAMIEDSYNGKPVRYFVRKDRQSDAHFLFDKTPQMMRFFSEFTGVEYPYDKYDQTVVELYTGAMEHTTATTHSFSLLPDERGDLDMDAVSVVAHELAHQWFGDLITCRDWSNGWLNEGFATYFEEMWAQHDKGDDEFKYSMRNTRNWYQGEDNHYRRPIVYYVFHDDGFELFDGHMYGKGAWVLHMLRHQLGETAFKRGINTYIRRFREKEVITADLERTLEEVTGRSMAQFFQQWVYSGGYPAFEVSYSWDGEHKMAKVKIKQTQKVDELTPCFVTPVDLLFTVPTSDEAAKDEHTSETRTVFLRVLVGEDGQVEQSFYLPLEREPLLVRFDPNDNLLKSLTFERSSKMLRYQLAHDPDSLGRIEAAGELGKKDDDESLKALTNALNNDPFWAVRAEVAEALGTMGSEKAQAVLLQTLPTLDAKQFSRVRAAIVNALGKFQAPQQTELAQRSAEALRNLLEKGDISYRVESAAAQALGKTRTEGAVETLTSLIERPSLYDIVQRGIFNGLAATGEDRVVDIMAGYVNNANNAPTLRNAATAGLWGIGNNKYRFSEEARQRAVMALLAALEHDSWSPVRGTAALALATLGEKRAAGVLEKAASRELESSVQRRMRLAAYDLRSSGKENVQIKDMRKDLDEMRQENRKLKEQVGALEARIK